MWIKHTSIYGILLSVAVYFVHCINYECDHQVWDDHLEGRGVKKLDFSCLSGTVTWNAPNGGLFVNVKGPAKEHQLCIQVKTVHTSALVSIMDDSSSPRRLLTIEESPKKSQQRHTMCFPAHGETLLFVEPEVGAFMTSKVILDYYVETNPKYGDEACRPCTDEELLYNYCTSDFVAVGQMKAVTRSASANIIPVEVDLIKRQSVKYFTKNLLSDKIYTGTLYAPPQCTMEYGKGKFMFMGIMKFGRAELRCAPTYEDFIELQKTSKLKGSALCS